MEPNVVGTTVAAPAREYLRFHLGGLAFLLALFTMTLPWLSFSYNCNETAGRQSAYELTTSHNVRLSGDIDTTAGTMRESRTIRIPAQWQIRLLIPLALVGLTLTLIRGRAGSLARGMTAVACALLTALWTASAEGLDSDWTGGQPSNWNPFQAEVDYGAPVTYWVFLLIALLNFTLPRGSPKSSVLNYTFAGCAYLVGSLVLAVALGTVVGAFLGSG